VQRVPVRLKVDPKVVSEALLRPGMSVIARVDSRTGATTETAAR
jgi:membrane fusion protein (multidrug efflux system)